MKILYVPRMAKGKKRKIVVYCRITINGLRKEFSTQVEVPPGEWDPIRERLTGTDPLSEVNNTILDSLYAGLKGVALNMELTGQIISPQSVINKYQGPRSQGITFREVLSDFNKSLIGPVDPGARPLSDITIAKHTNYNDNLSEFLLENKMDQLLPAEFKIRLATDLVKWLMETKTCGKTHAVRHIEHYSRALDYSVSREYIEFNPLASSPLKRGATKKPVSLENEELQKIFKHEFHSPMLQLVADLWLFQCGTGLSYMDIYRFQITTESDGRVWIVSDRGKNGNDFAVPLFPLARYILQKYKGKLPKITNQQYNRVLKEIAGILNIHKRLTTHIGRKTFASIKDSEGWSTESIAQMLGHKSVKTTEVHYLSKSKKRIINEMDRLGV